MALPVVTCLCPTYGRFESLRDAVACFLLQDYPAKRMMIFDDSPSLLFTGDLPDYIEMWHHDRFETLGHKRQAMLEAARTPLVAHWDDDDLYLPWHLSMLVEALQGSARACVKPRAGWFGKGPRLGWKNGKHPHHNVFEGQMLFDRQTGLDLGGYAPMDSGQAAWLLWVFEKAKELHTWNPPDNEVSYVYRWADGMDHVSARGKRASKDASWGNGEPIIPDGVDALAWACERVFPQFDAISGWRNGPRFGASGSVCGPTPRPAV